MSKARHPLISQAVRRVRGTTRALRSAIAGGGFSGEDAGKFLNRYPPVSVDVAASLAAAATDAEKQFFAHDGRLIDKWAAFLPVYERLLAPYRSGFRLPDGSKRPLRMIEIGVFKGGSLQFWRKYLGPEARICGIDIDESCHALGTPDLPVQIGSQADPAFLRSVVETLGGLDVVLDDGSHVQSHMRTSFETLFPLLSEGGLYIVEDVHTAYWRQYEGGYRKPGTFIEYCKGMVDDVNGWYHSRQPSVPAASGHIASITFFDSIVAIEKRRQAPPKRIRVPQ